MGSSLHVKHAAAALALVLGLLALLPARAATLDDLYTVTVVAPAGGEAASFRAAMGDLLVRVTGRRDAAQLSQLQPLLQNAGRYVTSYRRAAGNRLTVSFAGEAVVGALESAGLPFWGEDRPATLVWLAIDRGGEQRGLVTAEAASSERLAVEQVAQQRGLPLIWPSGGAGEDLRLRYQQAWSGDTASLAAAATAYGADGVLVGRASAGGGGYVVDWTFVGAAGSSQVRGDLGQGPHLAADLFASLYASTAAAQSSIIDLRISGVTGVAQYAEASRQLEALASVKDAQLRQVLPDALLFRVSVRGGLAALQRDAGAGGRLRPAGELGGVPVLVFQP